MNPIDEVKNLRPEIAPLTDDVREQLRRDLFDAEPSQQHGTEDLSVVDLAARRRGSRRTPARAVASAAAVVALMLAVGLALAARSSDDGVVTNGLAGREPTMANGDNEGPWTPPTVAPSPPELPLVGHHAWRHLLPFYYSPSDNQRMYAVYQQHIADCMDDGGFSYTPQSISGVDGLDLVSPLDRNAAEALGYHQPSDGLDTRVPGSAAELDYLNSCANAAMDETFGATEKFSTAVQTAVQPFDEVVNGWSDTEEGRATLAEWSACMADAGYDYARPEEARAIFEQKPRLTDEELATRLTDLDCDLEVGLTHARSIYEESAARRWIADNEPVIADLIEQKADYYDTLEQLEAEA